MKTIFLVLTVHLGLLKTLLAATIDCNVTTCRNEVVHCVAGEDCTVNCPQQYNCANTNISASQATSLTIQSDGRYSLYDAQITCPTNGNCNFYCTATNACQYKTSLICPKSGNCDVVCYGKDSCKDIEFQQPENANDGNNFTIMANNGMEGGVAISETSVDCPIDGNCNVFCDGDQACNYFFTVNASKSLLLNVTANGDQGFKATTVYCPEKLSNLCIFNSTTDVTQNVVDGVIMIYTLYSKYSYGNVIFECNGNDKDKCLWMTDRRIYCEQNYDEYCTALVDGSLNQIRCTTPRSSNYSCIGLKEVSGTYSSANCPYNQYFNSFDANCYDPSIYGSTWLSVCNYGLVDSDCTFNGYEPFIDDNNNGYPLHIWTQGTHQQQGLDTADDDVILKYMAKRGFVSIAVDYPGLNRYAPEMFYPPGYYEGDYPANCTELEKRASNLFNISDPTSAISILCTKYSTINCDKGIVLSGYSQGAQISILAANYGLDNKINGVFVESAGASIGYNAATCMNYDNTVITQQRLKLIIGINDTTFGGDWQMPTLSGYWYQYGVCSNNSTDCIQSDGSGWYRVTHSEVPIRPILEGAGHCFLHQVSGCEHYNNDYYQSSDPTKKWSFETNYNWLIQKVHNVLCNSNSFIAYSTGSTDNWNTNNGCEVSNDNVNAGYSYFYLPLSNQKIYRNFNAEVVFRYSVVGSYYSNVGFIFRSQNQSAHYLVTFFINIKQLALDYITPTARSRLTQTNLPSNTLIAPNTEYTIKVIAKGNDIKLYFDNVLYITHAGCEYQTGSVGLFQFSTLATFTSINIEEIPLDNVLCDSCAFTKYSTLLEDNWSWNNECEVSNDNVNAGYSYNYIPLNNGKMYDNFNAQVSFSYSVTSGIYPNVGFIFRAQNESAHYLITFFINIKQLALDHITPSGRNRLTQTNIPSATSIAPDTEYTIKVNAEGNDIKCYFDNVLYITYQGTEYQAGSVGLFQFSTLATFNSLTVEEIIS